MADNTSDQKTQSELSELVSKAREINADIDERFRHTETQLNEIEARVNESARRVEEAFTALDRAEKEAGEEFETLALEEAQELAQEQKED
ncbi:MAG: hypothetical protein B7X04_04385 [Parcubacteria group bacterium 21-54-25]|nr:MAG: hypothetical protein B7X04_04385 [Parcubacteria group bacterium 21-54-25]HQU08305.1 hypothetical protein [Candidatus Paceibacterota bacterium]